LQPILRVLPFAGIVYGPARMFVKPELAFLADLAVRQGISIGVFALAVALVYRVALGRIYSNGG
jgi:ABC-2 type transport system permease protein